MKKGLHLMSTIAEGSAKDSFADVPEIYVFSDFVSSKGLHIIAYLFSVKYAKDGEIFCNAVSAEKIAGVLHISVSTVKREMSRLKKLGIIKTTKTRRGNTFQLIVLNIEDDTFRGRNMEPSIRFARVNYSVITSGISSEALRLWLILARIGGAKRWAFSSQARLAQYLKVSERHIRNLLKELKELGLIETKRREAFGRNDYKLHMYINGSFIVNGFPGEDFEEPKTLGSWESEDVPVEGSVDTAETDDVLAEETVDATVPVEVQVEAKAPAKSTNVTVSSTTYTWLRSVIAGSPVMWTMENKERSERISDYVEDLMHRFGPEDVDSSVRELCVKYGSGYEPEFLFKLLDEHYGISLPADDYDDEARELAEDIDWMVA
ncbi:helix-turn-helix domain-containing protein [Sphaerisporangium sp. NPDC088356]|uniref:helix-turn-helix domain-containing protein n=1 Tax=Sphaerisporangium sp. NPDC088356 TaxID=3154871 RepID=UPI00344520A2